MSGDLYEEFSERKLHQLGWLRANAWYARQVLSFAPSRSVRLLQQETFLFLLCCFTALAGSWLALMDLRLKHPGYMGRECIAATIVSQALLTLAALRRRGIATLRPLAMLGCLPLFWLTGRVVLAAVEGANLEGYVLLIALTIAIQALSTLAILSSGRGGTKHPA